MTADEHAKAASTSCEIADEAQDEGNNATAALHRERAGAHALAAIAITLSGGMLHVDTGLTERS